MEREVLITPLTCCDGIPGEDSQRHRGRFTTDRKHFFAKRIANTGAGF